MLNRSYVHILLLLLLLLLFYIIYSRLDYILDYNVFCAISSLLSIISDVL
jgi:hypothetical protein